MRRSKTLYCAVCVVLAGVLALLLWRSRVEKAPDPASRISAVKPACDFAKLLPQFQPSYGNQIRIAPTTDGFTTVLPRKEKTAGRWQNPALPVAAQFPRDFVNPVRVQSGSADVSARPLNARSSTGRIAADGSLIYANAFDNCDVVYRSSEFKTEEFLVLHAPPRSGGPDSCAIGVAKQHPTLTDPLQQSPRSADDQQSPRGSLSLRDPDSSAIGATQPVMHWRWQLETRGLKARLTPAHTIELCDEQGVPRLRVNAPEGKDASGKPLRPGEELKLSITGDVLTLAADLRDCEYPVVIDPTWSSTGAMAAARTSFGVAVLQDGRVLFSGGLVPGTTTSLLNSCELFDPATSTFSAAGNLARQRYGHSATTLNTGKVLVAGGGLSHPSIDPSELYDPSTGAWTDSGAANLPLHKALLLNNGQVLACGGTSGGGTTANCSLYSVATGTWSATGAMLNGRESHALTLLADGTVLATGGRNNTIGPNGIKLCERYNPVSGTWSATGDLKDSRANLECIALNDGKVLMVANNYSAVNETYDPATGIWNYSSTMLFTPQGPNHGNVVCKLASGHILAGGQNILSRQLYFPATGEWKDITKSGTNVPRKDYSTTLLNDGRVLIAGGDIATAELFDSITPDVTASAAPLVQATDLPVAFMAHASDLAGSTMTYSWNFGDGVTSAEQNPQHSYASAGNFTATVTATGPSGKTNTASVTVTISRPPVIRLQTTEVVAFVGQAFTFDATTTTDPENALAVFDWDFGDGTPHGSGAQVSKVYETAGTYTVRLTVTDSAGVTSTLTRVIEVLSADQAGLFNGFINYKVSWDRNKNNKDTLSLDARVNVGDELIGKDTPVAVEIAGARFEGTLDAKLRDYADKNEKWQLKAGVRGQPAGSVSVKLKVKGASLGLGFNQAGVTPGGDPKEPVSENIPVHLQIGARTFELMVPSEFKFTTDGKRARGEGVSE